MIEQGLFIAGAAIFGALGVIHLLMTFFSPRFDARDPAVTEAMQATSPRISRDTTMWRAWIGFNASHSLGAILIAAIYIPMSLQFIEVIQASLWFRALPLMIGLCYVALAQRYWFRVPFIGILVATTCFAAALIAPLFCSLTREAG